MVTDVITNGSHPHGTSAAFCLKFALNSQLRVFTHAKFWMISDCFDIVELVVLVTDGLHLVGHLQHLVKVRAEAGHVLEEGLLLHLDGEVGQPLLLEDGCHLERR